MPTRAQLQHIRRHLYSLKRKFGSPVDIYFESSDTNDLETGKRVVTAQKWSIKRAVPLPRKVSQHTLLSIALKELFTRGAITEMGDRQVLIDRTDLPSDFQLGTENWYFIVDGIRYQVLSHQDYEAFAYIVDLKSTTGAPRYAQIEMKVAHTVGAAEGSTATDVHGIHHIVSVDQTTGAVKDSNKTVTDNVTVTQTIQANRDVNRTITDSIGVTEQQSRIGSPIPKTVSSAITTTPTIAKTITTTTHFFVSQVVIEALVVPSSHIRVSQAVVESLVAPIPHIRASQVVVEALVH